MENLLENFSSNDLMVMIKIVQTVKQIPQQQYMKISFLIQLLRTCPAVRLLQFRMFFGPS